MYDEGWMNSFVDRSEPAIPVTLPARSKAISAANHARVDSAEPPLKTIGTTQNPPIDPPLAFVPRRAISFSGHAAEDRITPPATKHTDDFDLTSRGTYVETEAHYVDWYGHARDDFLEDSHIEYKIYLEQLRLAESHLDKILQNANSALEQLRSLSDSFKHVDQETSAFQEQCEMIVADQGRTSKLAEDIAENLQYYAYLEPITKRLNAPGASNLVRRAEFSEILVNLDACIAYMQSHPKHRDATTYRGRYRQLLTRGLTLIRNQFTTALRDLAAETTKKMTSEQLNDTTSNALLYGRFRLNAPEFKRMGFEIQKRAVAPENGDRATGEAEYVGLLNELYQNYAATRSKLLYPTVTKKIANIAAMPSSSTDLVGFARSCIIFIRGLCLDEYELWSAWFIGEGSLYDFLETLCEPMYDLLRPRTIRETQLIKLCELCTFIQTQYLSSPDDSSDEDTSSPTDARPTLDFPRLIQPALEDAQTRLVFLALTVLRNDIEVYKPSPEDLDYPAKSRRVASKQPILSGKRSVNGHGGAKQNGSEENGHLSDLNGGASADWYPTLRKAIWLLGRIYRLVNSAVFDDLAHQIVHETTISLQSAATQVSKRASPTDSYLFLLKYLLLLKQQIIAYDIEFNPNPEIDFTTSLTHAFQELGGRGSLLNPLSWSRLVAGSGYALLVPKVVTNMLDAKSELDAALRAVITDFTASFVTRITEAISEPAIKTAGQAFEPLAATVKVRGAIEEQAPFLRRKLDEYLDDMRTRETLIAAIQDQVSLVYEEFCEVHVEGGKGRGRTGGGKGKGREDGVWDASVFTDWSRDVFGVVSIGFDDADETRSMIGDESE